jgi:hypothetical protein
VPKIILALERAFPRTERVRLKTTTTPNANRGAERESL